jgi:GAF domain
VTFASPGPTQNPILDENSFQQLLAAAYTLQEHNEVLRARNARYDQARISSKIASARSQILADGKDLASAVVLIADCLRSLTGADGASVCLVNDGYLSCAACSGTAAKVPGGAVASNSLVATERLRNGRAFQSANARSDIRLEPSLCLELQIGSLLAVPIQRNNEVAGLIELRWNNPDAFDDGDESICELAVGLIGEVLDQESGVVTAVTPTADQVAVADNSSAEHLTPITPKLDAPQLDDSAPTLPPAVPEVEVGVSPSPTKCRVCGYPLPGKDEFCGNCGMLAAPSDDGLQSKWASMWFMQQARKAVQPAPDQTAEDVIVKSSATPVSLKASPSDVPHSNDEIQNAGEAETEEVLADVKRGPRSVLSILKAQFKVRASGR